MDSSAPRLAKQPRRLRWALPLIGLLLLPLAWALFGPRGVPVQVSAKTWQLDVDVEQQVMESGSDWCDALPSGARDVSRRLMTDPSGGRGENAEHCRYSTQQWRRRWGARNEGEDPAPPRWPEPRLNTLQPGEVGAERLGKRLARYELQLDAADGRHWTCPLALEQWQRAAKGISFRIQVDRQGVADCATIPVM